MGFSLPGVRNLFSSRGRRAGGAGPRARAGARAVRGRTAVR